MLLPCWPINMNEYYVYLHRKASDGSIFYVGKGKNDRAKTVTKRSAHWRNTVSKHGLKVEIRFCSLTERQAIYLEKKMIQKIGLENLVNITPGGEGTSIPWALETKEKRLKAIRDACRKESWIESNKRSTSSEKFRKTVSYRSKKLHRTPEFKERHRQSMKAAMSTQKNKARVSRQWKGVERGPEFAKMISESRMGKKLSDSHVKNLRKSHSHLMKKVECIDNGMLFASAFYAKQWLEENGVATKSCQQQIRNVCKGRSVTACGYKWRYVES